MSNYPAAKYAYEYKTTGTNAGEWYLPALGELNEIYQNKTAIDKTLSALGKSAIGIDTSYHWSSSELSNYFAWGLRFSDGYVNNGDKYYDYYDVRPVLAF